MKLGEKIEKIENWSLKVNIPIFYGNTPDLEVIDWNRGDLEEFFHVLKAFQPQIIILDYISFSLSACKDKNKEEFEELDSKTKKEVTILYDKLSVFDSEICILELGFVHQGLLWVYREFESWLDYDKEIEDILSNYKAGKRNDQRKLLRTYARELANNPAFQKTKNTSEREYALNQLLSKKQEKINIFYNKEIISEASNILKFEIQPLTENDKQVKAIELLNKGVNIKIVSQKVGASESIIRKWYKEA